MVPPSRKQALRSPSRALVRASQTFYDSNNTCRITFIPMSCGPTIPICTTRRDGVAIAANHCSKTAVSHNRLYTWEALGPHRYSATRAGAIRLAAIPEIAPGTPIGVGLVWLVWCGVMWCAKGAATKTQWPGWSCTRENASREGCVSKRALCVVCFAPRMAKLGLCDGACLSSGLPIRDALLEQVEFPHCPRHRASGTRTGLNEDVASPGVGDYARPCATPRASAG